jgi:signal peptidase
MDTIKLIIRYFFNVIVWLLLGLLFICLVISFISSSGILGGHHLYIVQSGSMSPSIMSGDIIITSRQLTYYQNDVITFNNPQQGVVTHRIVEINNLGNDSSILTKGDANRSTDSDNISLNQIIGKVVLVLPRFGYLVVFSQQPLGMFILIGIPGLIIVLEEFLKLGKKHAVT